MGTYIRLSEGLNKYTLIPKEDKIWDHIKDPDNKDYYQSIYYYTQEHFNHWKKTKSLAGITNVTTDKLVFDLDDAKNPENAKNDALTLITKLIQMGIPKEGFEIEFSGNKGFSVEVHTTSKFSPEELKTLALNLSDGLKTRDSSVYDPQRIFRIPGTKHNKSGLYKFPITLEQLSTLTVDQIKTLAKDYNNVDKSISVFQVDLPESVLVLKEKKKKEKVEVSLEPTVKLDMTKKPRGWQDYVYSILEGHYESGERHSALMVLAAKCRAMNFDKQQTYFLCKSSLKKQAALSGNNEFDKEELWKNIIEESVYSDRWQGGSYSPKNNAWLETYCKRMGIKWDNQSEANVVSVTDAFSSFENFAMNIDNLTIKTGIKQLDDNLRLTVGMSSGLIASPGVGKTSVSLQILNNMSKRGEQSLFFSYDMYAPIVYQKLVQKHFNIGSTAMFEKFKSDPKFRFQVKEKLQDEYKNVNFCFKTGQTVPDIIDTIKEAEDNSGSKVKFIAVDYNELVISNFSDPTQSSAFVAQKMREIAQSMDLHVLSLFQPSKNSGSPSDEIKTYHAAKGSGAISQSVSVMLGMSRPGYNPQATEDDIFVNIACLKNRMGPLFSLDFGWNGLTGIIRELDDNEEHILKGIRDNKKITEDSF